VYAIAKGGANKMYRNLEAEMVREGIKRKDISKLLKVRYATVVQKLNGRYKFNLDEAFKIKEQYFPKLSIEYLFETDEKRLN
jgi:hypothetical protein